MAEESSTHAPLAAVVICSWLIPGGGYFLIGQKGRALTVFVAVVALFLMGILIGGIRIMDPPGWGQYGYMTQLVQRFDRRHQELEDDYTRVEPASAAEERSPSADDMDQAAGSALTRQPMAELADKPWYVGQILCGPMTLLASAVSVHAAHPSPSAPTVERWPSSHSRSWEIGALYTAVAGMLNLLVIIDSAHRASQVPQ